ncbi:MAG TPA: retropepsin-like aspartic protease [Novosphingobium sp.]|nr:retropepsin-like aspartic protease [Novosphingobium sp.]HZV09555.1 retropepsin-like aspartic protease [Novosphingobium sp.]
MSHAASTDPAQESFSGLLHAGVRAAADMGDFIAAHPLAQLVLLAMLMVLVGGLLRPSMPTFAGLLRFFGNLGLMGALAYGLVLVAGVWLGMDGLPLPSPASTDAPPRQQSVSGGETRIPLASDGHFWVRARVNGVPRRFLVDTGATLTTLSPDTAEAADVRHKGWGEKVMMQTANGTTSADMAVIDELRVGNVVARHLDAVVAPGLGETNVLGMNFLSRLASWRVEHNTLILVAHHPVAAAKKAAD